MNTAQFERLQTAAGGTLASDRSIVRAFWCLLSDKGKTREMRHIRHVQLREALTRHHKDQALFFQLNANLQTLARG
jgi:hypothetical protein